MSNFSQLEQLQTELQNAIAMRNLIMTSGQEYMIGRRRMQRPALAEVNKTIDQLEQKIASLQNSDATSGANFGSRLFVRFARI